MSEVHIYAIEHDQNGCSSRIMTNVAAVSPENALSRFREIYTAPLVTIFACIRQDEIHFSTYDARAALVARSGT